MYLGTACSGHFHALSVFEKNSSLRDGVGKPRRRVPSISTPGSPAGGGFSWVRYTWSSSRKAPSFRMYWSGVNCSFAAAAGNPGTLFSKIHRYSSSTRSFRPGRYGDSKYFRIPSEPSGSIFHESSIQNSSSSLTWQAHEAAGLGQVRSNV